MRGGEQTRDISKPFGTPQPQVSAGLSRARWSLFCSSLRKTSQFREAFEMLFLGSIRRPIR